MLYTTHDFVSSKTWHLEFYFKNAKNTSSSMIYITYQSRYDLFSTYINSSHMLSVFMVSFVKLLWPMLRFFSYTHDQDSRTHSIKKNKTLGYKTKDAMPKKHEPIKDAIPKWYEPKKWKKNNECSDTRLREKKWVHVHRQKERIAHALKDCKKR